MLRAGLTGGAASGKSTFARLLAARGAAVLDADEVVAGLYEPGRGGARAVEALFGGDVLTPQGGVDRGALAAAVLADAEARRRLEQAVHPLVRAAVAAWIDALGAPKGGVAVVEAALLVETGSWRDYDRLVVVTAPLEVRRRRALAAGWSGSRFEGVAAAQASDAERAAVADYVVDNDGDRDALERAAEAVWSALREDVREQSAGRPLPPRR